jgi:hypothetical protein
MMKNQTEVLSDSVMNALWFFNFYRPTDNLGKTQPSEELNAGKLARECVITHGLLYPLTYSSGIHSFWARCIPDAAPGAQARFKETLAMFFEAVNIQTHMRDTECIPDLESYIALRRDTSGNVVDIHQTCGH